MIQEIENRRSIRKYRIDEVDRKIIEEILYSATLALSAKNRQPWKFIAYQRDEKDKLVDRKTPFAGIENENRIVEICDSLSIGAAVENMILTASGYGLGTLWIANTCFAYNELVDFIGTDSQMTGIVAVGYPDEVPDKRPRKRLEDVVEYRNGR